MGNKAEECVSVHDVEEGEILEVVISEENFVKPPPPGFDLKKQQQNKFQLPKNYAPGLYNFAWSQAAQNKPFSMDYINHIAKSSKVSVVNSLVTENEVDDNIVIDLSGDENDDHKMVEKEEGELEEGEIEVAAGVDPKNSEEPYDGLDKEMRIIREGLEGLTAVEAEKSFDGLCSRLQNLLDRSWKAVSESNVAKKDDLLRLSFSAVQIVITMFCSMSQNQKEQKRAVVLRLLAQVMSQRPPLFSSDQMKEAQAMIPSNDSYAILSSSKERESELAKQTHENVIQQNTDVLAENGNKDLSFVKEPVLDVMAVDSSDQSDQRLLGPVTQGVSNMKNRVSLPLLDLHKDHDLDSLPSPTRETSLSLPLNKALFPGEKVIRPEWPAPQESLGLQVAAPRHYDNTDAFKAVSNYQQKFGHSSFHMNDRLPSPTPSEEIGDAGGDTVGEVSSFTTKKKTSSLTESALTHQIVSTGPLVVILTEQPLLNVSNGDPVNSTFTSAMGVPNKSKDPRLRRHVKSNSGSEDLNQHSLPMLNNRSIVDPLAELLESRKQKSLSEPVLINGPALKRQKNEMTVSGIFMDVQAVSQSGGWLEDRGSVGLPSLNGNHAIESTQTDSRGVENAIMTSLTNTNSLMPSVAKQNEHMPLANGNATTSIQHILTGIAVYPDMLPKLLEVEKQKSIDSTKYAMQSPSLNSVLTAAPAVTITPPKPSVIGQTSQENLQTTQTFPTDDPGKTRMKSRDPRRALHNNAMQKGRNLASDQSNANMSNLQAMHSNLRQNGQLNRNFVPSQDIASQFTNNLKNIADIMSVSQPTLTPVVSQATVTSAASSASVTLTASSAIVTPATSLATVTPSVPQATLIPAVSQVLSSQPAQVHPNFVSMRGVPSDSGHQQPGGCQISEEVVASQPQNTWGEVEHLFDGYDDQQKAAIQRERARRMEEQKKMFSARKLCLVLDLDHTLLNSAKFVEVEPMHDEILRKKEEQDRDKSHRHLFRLPNMGMWTKLRPGIWNFLEKASQLFELHLYTTGNKLYATEMAKVLDPKGVLFNGRVISRGDDGDITEIKDLEGVLGMESAVVIIDDSVRVWPHNRLNLIVVERYIYFPCSRRQFGLPGPSLLEIDHDERPEDGTLASSLAVIERTHI